MTPRVGLTPKQRDLLSFIQRYAAASDGASPSYDEMRVGVGLRSKSGIYRMLDALVERGQIRRLSGRARSVELLAPPPAGLALSAPTQARIRNLAERPSLSPESFLSAVLDAHGDRS